MSEAPDSLDSRVERERDFFNHSPETARHRVSRYYAITGSSTAAYEGLLRELSPGRRVLELGCGEGTAALRLASWGAHVRAVDISPSRVEAAQRAAAAEAVPGSVSFEVMNAEKLVFGDDEFDLVCGQAILHHLDLERTFAEVVRTLKPDGRAVFIEPLGHNPLINLYRSLTPALRTPDERPLVARDLELAGRYFADARFQFFHLTSFAAVPFVRFAWFQTLARRLEALDYRVLRRFPSLGKYAWRVVLDLAAPQQGAQLDPDQASPTSASI